MTRPRKPETQERRLFVTDMRKRINKTYKFLQTNNYPVNLRYFRRDLRRLCISYLEVDFWDDMIDREKQ